MDPNANLTEQLSLALLVQSVYGQAKYAERLATLVLALNEHLARGGAHRAAWRNTYHTLPKDSP